MGTPISLNPDVDTYVQGDPPIEVSIGAGGTNNTAALWESNNGVFTDKYAGTTMFQPNNATRLTTIIGRRVNRTAPDNSGGTVVSANGFTTWGKGSSAVLDWDTFVNYPNILAPSVEGFFEATTLDLGEKAIGFTVSNSYRNPELVGAFNTSFSYAWHLRTSGLAIPTAMGAPLSTPLPYKVGDVFRVSVNATAVDYLLNGVIVASTERINTHNLQFMLTYKSPLSWWDKPSAFNATIYEDYEGLRELSVSGLFPSQPNYTYTVAMDNKIITSVAIDGSEIRREKVRPKKTLALQFQGRSYQEYQELHDFWQAHEKHRRFVYQDLILEDSYIMRFDAPLSVNIRGAYDVDIQATLKEV